MFRTCLTFCLTFALAAGARAATVEVETLDGQRTEGELSAWTADAVTLTTSEGPQEFALSTLLAIRPNAPSAESEATADAAKVSVWVDLVDGSRLEGTAYTADKGQSRLTLLGGEELELPTRIIAAVRLQSQNEALARQWEQMRKLNVTEDLIVIRKNDAIDYLEGVVGQVTADKVHFELDGDQIPVARTKVDGMILYTAQRELPAAICRVEGRGTTRIEAQAVTLADGQLQVQSRAGLKTTLPWDAIRGIDFSAGKIQYLSDMQPLAVEWAPYFSFFQDLPTARQFFRPRYDQAFEGGPLTLGGKTYRKGLALRSRTETTYRLPEGFQRFEAVLGIDDRVAEQGHVLVTLRGDDQELWSETIRGGEPPVPVKLDIAGVRKLTIIVDYADDLDLADQLDVCDARISQ